MTPTDYNLIYLRVSDQKEVAVKRITPSDYRMWDAEKKAGFKVTRHSLIIGYKFLRNTKKKRAA